MISSKSRKALFLCRQRCDRLLAMATAAGDESDDDDDNDEGDYEKMDRNRSTIRRAASDTRAAKSPNTAISVSKSADRYLNLTGTGLCADTTGITN